GGLVGVDIHASAGVVRRRTVGARRVRKGIDPGCGIAPVEIARRRRDLSQRVVLVDPLQEQIDRRPITELAVTKAFQETRKNLVVLVAGNRLCWAFRSLTVVSDLAEATPHDIN